MFTKTRGEEPQPNAPAGAAPAAQSARPAPARVAGLGPSISLTGTLVGGEDLIIEGSVEGEIMVRGHKVTIGETGTIKADVYGRSICVEGQVDGNLVGEEQVVIRRSGRVRGNVTAPRVNLENGAKFKGSIDMQPSSGGSTAPDTDAKSGAGKTKAALTAAAAGAA